MKTNALFAPALILTLGMLNCANAQNWGSSTTGGSWNNEANWEGGSKPDATTSDASVLFNVNGPTPGTTAYTVTLAGPQSATHLKIDVGNSGSSLTLNPGGGSLLMQTSTPGSVTPTLTVNIGTASPHAGATAFTLNGGLSGTQGLSFQTETAKYPLIYMGGSNTITGGFKFDSAAMAINFHTPTALNGNALIFNQSPNILLGLRGTTFAYNWTSNIEMTGANARISTFSDGPQTLSGIISGSADYDLIYGSSSSQPGLMIVTGANTYLGDTNISNVTLRAAHSQALGGAGAANVTLSNATLQLSGGITISDKSVQLAGTGHQLQGSLQNLDGNNEWAGNVALGSTASPTVNVTDGQLTISGVVSGSTGLRKTGTGTLILDSSDNSYTGSTAVTEGTLLVNGNIAAGDGLTVAADAILGGTGVIAQQISLQGTLAAGDGGTGSLSVTGGNIAFAAGSTLAITVDTTAITYTSLNLSGDLLLDTNDQTLLTLTDAAPGDALLEGTAFRVITYGGNWNGGLFTYNGSILANHDLLMLGGNEFEIIYNAAADGGNQALDLVFVRSIPEPGSVILGITGLGLLMFLRRRRAFGAI